MSNDSARRAAAAIEDPYVAAKRDWNERYGDFIARARNWRMAALAALFVSAVQATGLVWISGQARVVPYVVEVDKLGDAVGVHRADRAAAADARVIKATLAAWITDVRGITSDDKAERAALSRAYAFASGTSAAFLTDYYRSHSPLGEAHTTSVSVTAVLPVSDRSYEVQWDENSSDSQGRALPTTHWLAHLTLAFSPPGDENGILANPLGLFITSLSWTQRV